MALGILERCSRAVWKGRAPRPPLASFFGNRRGSIAIYVGFVSTALMGASVIVFDIGRLAIVRTQVQNAADAGAMAGAYQLDGRAGARVRAEAVARNAAFKRRTKDR